MITKSYISIEKLYAIVEDIIGYVDVTKNILRCNFLYRKHNKVTSKNLYSVIIHALIL